MAPGRKKPTSAAPRNWKVGDLVLAKMRGFPAWPAKVVAPEDHEQSPKATRVCVEFFGSLEWRFLKHEEISEFTPDVRATMEEKVRNKVVQKQFGNAVKQICHALDARNHKSTPENVDLDNASKPPKKKHSRRSEDETQVLNARNHKSTPENEDNASKPPKKKHSRRSEDAPVETREKHRPSEDESVAGEKTREKHWPSEDKSRQPSEDQVAEDKPMQPSGQGSEEKPVQPIEDAEESARPIEEDDRVEPESLKVEQRQDEDLPVESAEGDQTENKTEMQVDKKPADEIQDDVQEKKMTEEQDGIQETGPSDHDDDIHKDGEDLQVATQVCKDGENLQVATREDEDLQAATQVRKDGEDLQVATEIPEAENDGNRVEPSIKEGEPKAEASVEPGREPQDGKSTENSAQEAGQSKVLKTYERRRKLVVNKTDKDKDKERSAEKDKSARKSKPNGVSKKSEGKRPRPDSPDGKDEKRKKQKVKNETNEKASWKKKLRVVSDSDTTPSPARRPKSEATADMTKAKAGKKEIGRKEKEAGRKEKESGRKEKEVGRKDDEAERKPEKKEKRPEKKEKRPEKKEKEAGRKEKEAKADGKAEKTRDGKDADVRSEKKRDDNADTKKRDGKGEAHTDTKKRDGKGEADTKKRDIKGEAHADARSEKKPNTDTRNEKKRDGKDLRENGAPAKKPRMEVKVLAKKPAPISDPGIIISSPVLPRFPSEEATNKVRQAVEAAKEMKQRMSQKDTPSASLKLLKAAAQAKKVNPESPLFMRPSPEHVAGSIPASPDRHHHRHSEKHSKPRPIETFQTMLDSINRGKDSILKATRHAIECANKGFAKQVMDIILRKLENERDNKKRVDLLFLVDSMTQYYFHKSRGDQANSANPKAGYPLVVEACLSRFLSAVAPPNSSSENYRQCMKVVNLWLQRNIMDAALLKKTIDELGIAAGLNTTQRQYQQENQTRAVDDPLRGMDDMVMDEYGSNTGFQIPELMVRPLDDEEEEEEIEATNVMASSTKHKVILAELDGEMEMEMEDVSPTSNGMSSKSSPYPEADSPNMPPPLPPSPPPLPPCGPPPSPPPPPPPPY